MREVELGFFGFLTERKKQDVLTKTGQIKGGIWGKVDKAEYHYHEYHRHEHYYYGSAESKTPGIDKKIIVDFDLKPLVKQFTDGLGPRTGPFAFSLSVPKPNIGEEYILKRLANELLEICDRRPVHPVSVFLMDEDRDDPVQPLKRLEGLLDKSVARWFDRSPPENLLASFWNYDGIPSDEIVKTCWEKLAAEYGEILERGGHTLVTIWINQKEPAVDLGSERFSMLTLPKRFDEEEVDSHFRNHPETARLGDSEIDRIVASILEYKCEIANTYGQMAQVVNNLNKGGAERHAYPQFCR